MPFGRLSENQNVLDCNKRWQKLPSLPKRESCGEAFTHTCNCTTLPPLPKGEGKGRAKRESNVGETQTRNPEPGTRNLDDASVLIVVMWVMFGLIAVTLYFGHSMSFELRAADNRVAGMEAEQAIEGARRYFSCLLSNVNQVGTLPDPTTYLNAAVPVGNAHFWLIGRGLDDGSATTPTAPHFGLIDESSKFNINSAPSNILINLPRMTPQLVANILAWRSTNTTTLSGGAESDTYSTLPQPYLAKNAPFETVDELRLIYGMDMDTLYGEDANLNGILDPNENDGDKLPPSDNMDGHLDPGLLEYVTCYSREPSTCTYTNQNNQVISNVTRVNLTTLGATGPTALQTNLEAVLGTQRADQIVLSLGQGRSFTSPLQFYVSAGLSASEIPLVEPIVRGSNIVGLVNVNTASLAVLNCIPGLTNGMAQTLVSYRQSNTNNLNGSIAWVTQVLDQNTMLQAGPYLTGRSYQYMADIAALGHNGRGYRRVRFVYDTRQGVPVIIHRQDLSHLGWALGKEVRDKWLLGKQTP